MMAATTASRASFSVIPFTFRSQRQAQLLTS